MVSNELLRTLNDYKARIGEPFKITEEVIEDSGRDYVNTLYLDALVTAPETTKAAILDRMYRGWTAFAADRGRDNLDVRRWGRATVGMATVCRFTSVEEVRAAGELGLAADVIVRISRWFHSLGSRFSVRNPDATFVVQSVWGNAQDLRRMPSVCRGALKEGVPRSRPRFAFKPGVGPGVLV